MKGATSNLACGERHAAERGPDPNTNVGFSADTALAGVCAGTLLFRRTSTLAGIRLDRFWIGFSTDQISIPRHVSSRTDPRNRVCRWRDPWRRV